MFDDGQDVMDEIFWNKKDRFQAVNKYVIADCWLPQVEDKCIHDVLLYKIFVPEVQAVQGRGAKKMCSFLNCLRILHGDKRLVKSPLGILWKGCGCMAFFL